MTTAGTSNPTPMMQQFQRIKLQHPGMILFYRMGDFYEMFGDDAVTASKVLQIQLTTRNKNKEGAIPMCGVPVHAFDQYLNKLTASGLKVAVCEQTEDPAQAKGLVRREVTRIVTPGTVISPDLLDSKANNFLCAIFSDLKKNRAGVAFCDLTTGEFEVDEVDIHNGWGRLLEILALYRPREILVPADNYSKVDASYDELVKRCRQIARNQEGKEPHIEFRAEFNFDLRSCKRDLQEHFEVNSLAGFGLENLETGICVAGAVLGYLKETQQDILLHIQSPRKIPSDDKMVLDDTTIRNLELFDTFDGLNRQHTLVHLLDQTKTPMGARLLRRWMAAPLLKKEEIEGRFSRVNCFLENSRISDDLRKVLGKVGDLERLIARISMPHSNISDLVRFRLSLEPLPRFLELLQTIKSDVLKDFIEDFDSLADLFEYLESHILENPRVKPKEGGFIQLGINKELDRLSSLMKNGKQLIAAMEAEERSKTGINSLKIGYNRVFGYYLEVTNNSKHLTPDHYIRKQTLVNGERFVTEELKELEESILSAEEESKTLEFEIYESMIAHLQSSIQRIQKTAVIIANVDVLGAFAYNAKLNNYCRPELDDNPNGRNFELRDARHPVIETINPDDPFIPNDLFLDTRNNFILVITGPNMGGKSTYMRQAALISLMAQIGSYIPARKAKLPLFDRIFTRVGASDNLARGQSTFMVEMSEAAAILNNATKHSLVILDEIGRGTSTFDGISIAWSITEHLHELGAMTLFATHYHELILLEEQLAGVSNAKVVVHEEEGKIAFLRKVVAGYTDKSYGIQVAALAGLPFSIIDRSKEILNKLKIAEKKFGSLEENPADLFKESSVRENEQLSFLPAAPPWIDELRDFDINYKTPLQAMEFLSRIQKKI